MRHLIVKRKIVLAPVAIAALGLSVLASPVLAQATQSGPAADNRSVKEETTINITDLVPSNASEGRGSVIDEVLAEIDDDNISNSASTNNSSLNIGADNLSEPDIAGLNSDVDSGVDSGVDAGVDAGVDDSTAIDLTGLATNAPTTGAAEDVDQNSAEAGAGTVASGDVDALITDAGSSDNQTADNQRAATAQPSARIGRRELSNIGLVSIGLEDTNPTGKQLNSLIWQGSNATDIATLLVATPAYGPSAELNRLLSSALLRQAVPPRGAADMADEMVKARLAWLADAGRSDALAQLIRKLPDDDAWKAWRRWLVEYDLLTSNDEEACREVKLAVGDTLDPFWHQAQVVCQILSGDNLAAGFTADIVQASGLADPEFTQLVDLLLGRRSEVDLNDAALKPLHLVMMDAAHLEISQDQLAALPASLLQARVSLRYVQRDAQLSIGFQALSFGLSDINQTAGLLRSQYDPDQPIIQAAARIGAEDNTLNGLIRSNLYAQLSGALDAGTNTDDFDALLVEAMRFEVALGQANLLLPLYANMITQRMAVDGLPPLSPEVLSDFAVWVAAARANQPLDPLLGNANPAADTYRQLLSTDISVWSPDMIAMISGWDLLPLLKARGVMAPEMDYTALISQLDMLPAAENRQVHPLKLLALQQAAADQRVGEAILLAAKALEGHSLVQIRSDDLAQILAALSAIGLNESAQIIAGEALQAHILSGHFSDDG